MNTEKLIDTNIKMEIENDTRKLKLVVAYMSMIVLVLFGLGPLI